MPVAGDRFDGIARDGHAFRSEPAGRADAHGLAAAGNARLRALARHRTVRFDRDRRGALRGREREDRLRERVRRSLLERRCDGERTFPRTRFDLDHARDGGAALGERSGLVDDEARQPARVLECGSIADQDAVLRRAPGTHDDGGGRREPECAGTGDHEDGDGVDQRARRIARHEGRRDEGHDRDRDHDRHEHARDPVGEPLDRRLAALRLRDQAHDAREQRRLADAGRDRHQHAILIDGARVDDVAGRLRDRAALAGQHALVDGRGTRDDRAVDRHGVARAHDDTIARVDFRQRDLDERSRTLDARRVRLQADEPFECGRRSGPGARLEQLAEQHQRDDRGTGLEVHVLVEAHHGHDGGQSPRHRGAQRHQHVHVRAAAAQRVVRADVEAPPDPELHRRRERELEPARQHVVVRTRTEPGQRLLPQERGDHLRHQREREQRGDDELAPQRTVRGGPAGLFLRALLLRVRLDARLVARALDRREERLDRCRDGIEPHLRRLGREVDRRLRLGKSVQHLLDARRTGSAGHAFECEVHAVAVRNGRTARCSRGTFNGGGIHQFSVYLVWVSVKYPLLVLAQPRRRAKACLGRAAA